MSLKMHFMRIIKVIKTYQGAKKIIFTACPSGKLKLAFTSPRRHFNQPQKLFVLLLFKFLVKHHLPVGQVNNRIHQPDSKIHQPRANGQYFLCTLLMIIEYAGIRCKALNPCKKYQFLITQAGVPSYSCTCIRNKYLSRVNLYEMSTNKSY